MEVSGQFHVLAAVPPGKEPHGSSKLTVSYKSDPCERRSNVKFLACLLDKGDFMLFLCTRVISARFCGSHSGTTED
jgi:S-adenosylmethionine:tRNA-ribosyltransferase-isomerase (queuine synthetase)